MKRLVATGSLPIVLVLLALPSVIGARPLATASAGEPEVEAQSLLGKPLTRPELPADFEATQTALLAEARQTLEAAPGDLDAMIWVGRRTAYLGRYREAIEVFTHAITEHPESARLYRHRGHRWLSVRELDRAIADLQQAAELVKGKSDVVEQDGLPNERGIPTSTTQTNIWYHLGLAHYLKGDFAAAIAAFGECRSLAGNPDMAVAASYWLYLSLRRAGRQESAVTVLGTISPDLEIIENHDYFHLLRAYATGGQAPDALLEVSQDSVASATKAYGVGAWHLLQGDKAGARGVFERIVAGSAWAAFGHIAAEAELARLTK